MMLKWIAVLGLGLSAVQASAGETPVLKTQKEKVSYGIGVDTARNLQRLGVQVDTDILMKAIKDVLAGEKLLMSEGELRSTMRDFQAELRQRQAVVRAKAAEENKKQGEAFLAENKTKAGVVTLPSGLQYKVVKAGNGKMPTDADTVECHYRGTLLSGTEFDSSHLTGKPAVVKVTAVIAGWKEALKLMPVGSKWQLFIPPQLAYGERGAGQEIGPNATLVFDVELLAVK